MLKHKKIRESGLFKSFGYIYRVSNVILTRKEKESLVIKLAEEGKTTRYIAEKAHVSLKDIGTILRRYTGEEESPYREKGLSMCTRAFRLFKEGKNLVDVAIDLNIDRRGFGLV
jgi:DNA invertase Pin-like site-specific DNA recombinase